MKADGLSRRDFLRGGSTLALAGLIKPGTASPADAGAAQKSRVVLIRDVDVLDKEGSPKPAVLHEMLNAAVAALYREKDSRSAWRKIVKPGDVVGIKSNVCRPLITPPVLEEAIRGEIVAAGVKAEDVAVDDRGVRGNPVFGRATALINVRPMRTHHWSGLGTCIKNMIMFAPRPPDYHGDTCAALGAIWKLPEISGKVRLNVLVMLTPLFHSVGPHGFSKEHTWPYRGLIVSADPVAADATGARVIAAKRKAHFGEDRPINPPPHHIELADTRYGLGRSDPAAIDLVRLGWPDEALI
ncbi:MAG: DUF362 domain-containing protein [Vicinamibacteria bacterium]|nr:DUF362 domain-containing protein [Vicinamibacteria bacterium]